MYFLENLIVAKLKQTIAKNNISLSYEYIYHYELQIYHINIV